MNWYRLYDKEMNKFNPSKPPVFGTKKPQAVFKNDTEVSRIRLDDGDPIPFAEENVKYYFEKDLYEWGATCYIIGFLEADQPNPNYASELRSYKRQLKKHEDALSAWNIEKEKWDKAQARKKKREDLELLAKLKAKYEMSLSNSYE